MIRGSTTAPPHCLPFVTPAASRFSCRRARSTRTDGRKASDVIAAPQNAKRSRERGRGLAFPTFLPSASSDKVRLQFFVLRHIFRCLSPPRPPGRGGTDQAKRVEIRRRRSREHREQKGGVVAAGRGPRPAPPASSPVFELRLERHRGEKLLLRLQDSLILNVLHVGPRGEQRRRTRGRWARRLWGRRPLRPLPSPSSRLVGPLPSPSLSRTIVPFVMHSSSQGKTKESNFVCGVRCLSAA